MEEKQKIKFNYIKVLKVALRVLAFACTFVMPILLLGVISPLVHGELGKGLTGLGYIAVALAIVVIAFKLMTKILKMKKSWKRALIISAFPIGIWVVLFLGIDYVQALLNSICDYWLKVGIFIFVGRGLAIAEECIHESEETEKEEGEAE